MSTPIPETPWMIEGGAQHSVQVARNLAFMAAGGTEGIIRGADLEVRETAVPGSTVRVFPGTFAVLNRAAGAKDEMYVDRIGSELEVAIAATGASARSDLIVARIENPWASGETWPDPTDPTVGPYASIAVISDVPSSTTTVADLGLSADHSMIALARIDLPASTGTVTQALIHDLRRMANAVRVREFNIIAPTVGEHLTSAGYTNWPNQGNMTLDVPEWATHVKVRAILAGIAHGESGSASNVAGALRIQLGFTSGSVYSEGTTYNLSLDNGVDRATLMCGSPKLAIPKNARGELNVPVRIEGYKGGGSTDLYSTASSMLSIEVEFINEPESNV